MPQAPSDFSYPWAIVSDIWDAYFQGNISMKERDAALKPLRALLAEHMQTRPFGAGLSKRTPKQ